MAGLGDEDEAAMSLWLDFDVSTTGGVEFSKEITNWFVR